MVHGSKLALCAVGPISCSRASGKALAGSNSSPWLSLTKSRVSSLPFWRVGNITNRRPLRVEKEKLRLRARSGFAARR